MKKQGICHFERKYKKQTIPKNKPHSKSTIQKHSKKQLSSYKEKTNQKYKPTIIKTYLKEIIWPKKLKNYSRKKTP